MQCDKKMKGNPFGAICFVLAKTENYEETLEIRPIAALPGMVEWVIQTRLLTAKNPDHQFVKSRTCIELGQLEAFHQALGAALELHPT